MVQTGQAAWIWNVTEFTLALILPSVGQALVACTLGVFGGIATRAVRRWQTGQLPRVECKPTRRLAFLIAASCLPMVCVFLVLLYFSAPPNFDPQRARLYGEWSLGTVIFVAFVVFLFVSWQSLRRMGALIALVGSLAVAIVACGLVNGVVLYRFGTIAPWNDVQPWDTQPLLLVCPQVFTAVICLVTAIATAIATRWLWTALEGRSRAPAARRAVSGASATPVARTISSVS